MEELFHYLRLQDHLTALALGSPRIMTLLQILPFMGPGLVTGQLRFGLGLALYAVLHPLVLSQTQPLVGQGAAGMALLLSLTAKEIILGFILAFLAGRLFWMVQSAGFLIDNQRGASMAVGSDPLSGEETSPLSSFLFQCLTCIFFSSGAFLVFLETIYASYQVWPVDRWLPFNLSTETALFFAEQVNWLMAGMLLLSAPLVVAALLTDLALGLANRFAPQLNVYVLAMPIKSGLTAFFMIMYLSFFVIRAPGLLADFQILWRRIQGL